MLCALRPMKLGLIEQLTYSTVRIETELNDGGRATGTGFFMNLLNNRKLFWPVIVTNKHVAANAKKVWFHTTFANEEGWPDLGNHQRFELDDFEQYCINHPDPKVDLTVFPLAPFFRYLEEAGKTIFTIPLETELIPTDAERENLSSMEEVVMIGYPNGIWDSKNNLPITRRGVTASHPNISWRGNPEFLVDIASFPGSSGSPIFLANIGGYLDKHGNSHSGANRIKLLGVLYAGTMHTAEGEIIVVQTPVTNVPVSITQIPNNIGVAVNSKKVLDFEPILREKFESGT